MSTFMSEEVKSVDPNGPVHGEHAQSDSFEEVHNESAMMIIRVHQIATLSRRLEGKLLTICDAIIADNRQNKAVKDLVRDALREFRFNTESVAGNAGDEYSIGVSTLDIEETVEGFKIPTMMPPKEGEV